MDRGIDQIARGNLRKRDGKYPAAFDDKDDARRFPNRFIATTPEMWTQVQDLIGHAQLPVATQQALRQIKNLLNASIVLIHDPCDDTQSLVGLNPAIHLGAIQFP